MNNLFKYTPHTAYEINEMLKSIGISSLDKLFENIPESVRLKEDLPLPHAMSEWELLNHMRHISENNIPLNKAISFLGAGSYYHLVPSAISHLIYRGEFYTAYTPYQPEASQGTLQAIYEFQSMICHLTGMDVANASHYDGATALAEGALMAIRETGRKEVLVSRAVHPEYRQVLSTYLKPQNILLKEVPIVDGVTDIKALEKMVSDQTALVIVQYPNFFGSIEELGAFNEAAHKKEALFQVSVGDPISLGLLLPPGSYGADIVTGEAQSFGIPLSFGGPSVGFMACRSKLTRRLPGRIAGATQDLDGKRAFVLTLQAREQHIRREKAASNICTNEGLCALAVTVFLALLGPQGLKEMANLCYQKAHYAYSQFIAIPGIKPLFQSAFFHEFVLKFPITLDKITTCDKKLTSDKKLICDGKPIFTGYPLIKDYPEYDGCYLLCVTEAMTKQDIDISVNSVKKHLATWVVPA